MTIPQLSPVAREGRLRCGSRPAPGAPTCGAPAAWHVAWRLAPVADFSLLCDEHMTAARRNLAYADQHAAQAECDLPGTGWLIASPSRCVITTTNDRVTDRTHEAASQ